MWLGHKRNWMELIGVKLSRRRCHVETFMFWSFRFGDWHDSPFVLKLHESWVGIEGQFSGLLDVVRILISIAFVPKSWLKYGCLNTMQSNVSPSFMRYCHRKDSAAYTIIQMMCLLLKKASRKTESLTYTYIYLNENNNARTRDLNVIVYPG